MEKKFYDAIDYCSDHGGRLCTKEELSFGCASGGGCGFDSRMVWSQTKYGMLFGLLIPMKNKLVL